MKFEHTEVFNFQGAIRGARNPLESWDLSDSGICKGGDDGIGCVNCCEQSTCKHTYDKEYKVGKNDMRLMKNLIKASIKETNSHSKFLRQIMVCVDITAPMYWWKEFDTYKVGTTANSTSFMHKGLSKEFDINDFENDLHTDTLCGGNKGKEVIDNIEEEWGDIRGYESLYKISNICPECEVIDDWKYIINRLNKLRNEYLKTKDVNIWRHILQILPESWLQTRTVTLNYQVLRQMYFDRRHHTLSLWSVNFIEWLKTLPYAEELIMYEGGE